jgi:hypothetical protein
MMVERERIRGGGSIRDRIRLMVIDDEEIKTKDIIAKLKPKNDPKAEMPSKFLIESLRNDTRQTLRLLRELGRIR